MFLTAVRSNTCPDVTRRRQYVLAQIGDSAKSFRQVFPGEIDPVRRIFNRNRVHSPVTVMKPMTTAVGYASAINGSSFRPPALVRAEKKRES
jgi:hypothetical protein